MANKKITELTEETSPVGADLLPLVDDVSGTPTTKKVTVTNLMTLAPVQTADISGLATQVSLGNHEALTSSVHGISAFGATLVDDADASAARTTLGLGTAATSASTDFSSAFYNIETKTADYTLTNSDNGKLIYCNATTLIDITVPSGLTSGFNCRVVQGSTGRVRVIGSGATINGYSTGSFPPNAVIGQHGVLDVVSTGTNAYSLYGDVVYYVAPDNEWSIELDGTNDYATLSTSYTLAGVFTVAGWFRADTGALSTNKILAGRITGATNYLTYVNTSGNIVFRHGSTSGITITADSSTWYHLIHIRDSSNVQKFYVNGTQYGTVTNSASYVFDFIGGSNDYPSNTWLGNLDEWAIWGSDQTANISDIYTGATPVNLSGLTTPPNHYWRMGDDDSGSGSTVTDSGSTGGRDLTLQNNAAFEQVAPS